MFEKLEDIKSGASKDTIVVAMSPQSRASLASLLGFSSREVFLRIATLFKRLGVKYVVDVAAAADIALIEAREEFMVRHRNSKIDSPVWEKPSTTLAHSSSRVKHVKEVSEFGGYGNGACICEASSYALRDPCWSLAVQGWTCYAEKTHPQVLPLMSSVKSAQQILGCVLKRYVRDKCKENNADGGKIFFGVSATLLR